MNLQSVLTLLSVVTASLILIIGVVLLTGLFLPAQVPVNYRYTLGTVMTLYALYRIGMAVAKYRRRGENDDPMQDES
jgi:membrane protein YdbS with pleckstrin-like domain